VWRLDWTENDARRDTTWTKTHHSEASARRHATGLCAKRPPDKAVADVFTDGRSYPVPGPDGSSP